MQGQKIRRFYLADWNGFCEMCFRERKEIERFVWNWNQSSGIGGSGERYFKDKFPVSVGRAEGLPRLCTKDRVSGKDHTRKQCDCTRFECADVQLGRGREWKVVCVSGRIGRNCMSAFSKYIKLSWLCGGCW